ncbi:MAG: GDP-mannose 4,6-dehydratase [Candidatus Eisenbacteria bacterium]|uniref:GDP-mannose 4,6-dehydratase n=1 Tax=Eiseniibacteriota bacterium TaxID=2212470 RepID=A0A948RY30_UNCEI|nr:GDP-mannose 4,6-dehydratase [Candidatus Eisenbacteria bacterium]MBU1947492.1 GDP-mannose 4,6-dehydratase [Candidatus Eisenbacteria bacterium]MBU2691682.1 GDP-mannose 4,6-dehydratase [Candidatus Eisenbacteria bacterium]
MALKHLLITGGAGFIGSHAALHFAERGLRVTILDNLSRFNLLGKEGTAHQANWNRLDQEGIRRIKGDVRDFELVRELAAEADAILHTAAQTAVTTSVVKPDIDFSTNALGTFQVLEAARQSPKKPAIVYCSTNKVYGDRVNQVPVIEGETHYSFGPEYSGGIPEDFGIDLCEHTPYGCSKLTGDLYVQDYGRLFGLKVGVFRMSCIYGTWQFGVEDQGWVAWFTIAALTGQPITIFGDGKQVRDVLWVEDLIAAYEAFLETGPQIGVYNMGGGPEKTLSLLSLLQILREEVGSIPEPTYDAWRPSDQKVYISNISKAVSELGWSPKVTPEEGVRRLAAWVRENADLIRP